MARRAARIGSCSATLLAHLPTQRVLRVGMAVLVPEQGRAGSDPPAGCKGRGARGMLPWTAGLGLSLLGALRAVRELAGGGEPCQVGAPSNLPSLSCLGSQHLGGCDRAGERLG